MTSASLPAVRGRRSAIYSKDPKAVSVLTRHLDLLGVAATINPDCRDPEADLCFLDVDTSAESDFSPPCGLPQTPIVALVGTETPGRLEWMMRYEPSSVLMKPLVGHGIYTAVVVALADMRRREQEFLRALKLEERIRARRIVVAAIVRVMQQYGVGEPEAFGMLRNAAQQRRITIENVCAEVASEDFLPVRLVTSR